MSKEPSNPPHFDPSRDARRSVKFTAIPSTLLTKFLKNKEAPTKGKTTKTTSKAAEPIAAKLIFDYGPTPYKGLLLHRKIKIAPFAEHFQKKYPQIRVYYHPTNEYNVITVRLKDCIVLRMLISNICYSTTEDITKNPFYKLIDASLRRMELYPNLLLKPFRDAICMMTLNLDIDYESPWYRVEFPRTAVDDRETEMESKSSGRKPGQFTIAAPCLVETNTDQHESVNWKKFLRTIESSPDFEDMLKNEF